MTRYYAYDRVDDSITALDNTERAIFLSQCEEFIVIDTEKDERILLDGTRVAIKEQSSDGASDGN